MEKVLIASKKLKDAIKIMEGYLIFLDEISKVDIKLMGEHKEDELHFIKDCEGDIKNSFEEYMKCIAEVKAKIEKL